MCLRLSSNGSTDVCRLPMLCRDHRERHWYPLWLLPQPVFRPGGSRSASGRTGAVKAGEASRSAAEGLALTVQARAAARLSLRLAGLGSRFWHGRSGAEPVPSSSPLGGGWGRHGAPRCLIHGGQEAMPGSSVGGGGNLRSALTGPPIAALTGVPLRPNEREPPRPATHGPPAGWQP